MWIWVTVPVLAITLFLLIRAEERVPRDVSRIKLWKPLATLLVILVCVLSFTRPSDAYDTGYTLLILGGLVLSLVGDVLLIYQANPRAFLGGLVAFLLAHLFYIVAFVYLHSTLELGGDAGGEIVAAVGLGLVGLTVYRYLSPGLGQVRVPVIVYIIVISIMVHRALAVALAYVGSATQPALIVAGAVLFYLSDAILAVNRFRFGGYVPKGRLLNLSTYYAGQLLLALSASFF